MKVRKLTQSAVFLALAMIAFLLEGLVPPPVPAVPWAKLGLSNIFVLMTLFVTGAPYALVVLLAKCLLGGIFAGFLSLWYSLSAGFVSLLAGLLLYRFCNRFFSLPAISAVCAALHNAVQVVMAVVLMGSTGLWYFLPLSAAIGLATGTVTGALAWFCLRFLRKFAYFR